MTQEKIFETRMPELSDSISAGVIAKMAETLENTHLELMRI